MNFEKITIVEVKAKEVNNPFGNKEGMVTKYGVVCKERAGDVLSTFSKTVQYWKEGQVKYVKISDDDYKNLYPVTVNDLAEVIYNMSGSKTATVAPASGEAEAIVETPSEVDEW